MTSRVLPLMLVLLLASPGALAQWRAAGTFEPDTPFDAEDGRMWLEPDVSPLGARAYFNAFQTTPSSVVNPNVGLLESRVQPAGLVHHRALLGVWKDCNRDGYIGQAETALYDYRAELLLDDSVCPQGLGHNDGQWVTELLVIGMVDPCEYEPDAVRERDCPGVDRYHANERVIYVNETYVWGDIGAPGEIPGAECVVTPLPAGTLRGTGAMLRYADCQTGHAVARAVNDIDNTGTLGLRFDDPENPHRSGSHLNQPLPLGMLERSADPAATIWDCNEPKGGADVRDPTGLLPGDVQVHDPTGGALGADKFPAVILYALTGIGFRDGTIEVGLTDADGSYAWLPPLAPDASDPTDKSLWNTLTHATQGPNGDCNATHSPLHAAYPAEILEGDDDIIHEARKTQASLVFTLYDGHRGLHESLDPTTGKTTPSDLGLFHNRHERQGSGPLWSARGETQQDPQLLHRGRLEPAGAQHFTYYAHLGPDATTLGIATPTSTTYAYGSEWCGTNYHGERNGWVCDPTQWWRDAQDQDIRPHYARGEPIGPLPGDPYHLRDVDCYDGQHTHALPIHASLAATTPKGPC